MGVGEKEMEILPRDVASGKQFANARGYLPLNVGLERFFVVVMLKLRSGPCGLFPNRSGRISFRSRCPHSFLSGLVPAGRTGGVGPTVLGFKRTYRGVKNDPISIRRTGFECSGMNLVQHDVNMEMLFVVVGNDHILVVLVPELVQCVYG
jgi:hypothetical protein